MIRSECLGREWILQVSKRYKADRILVEKAIRALVLLEALSLSPLQFIFKGGTALMLLLRQPHRLSIDIDILLPSQSCGIEPILDQICSDGFFSRYEMQVRMQASRVPKSHYKLFYISAVEDLSAETKKESSILLDVLHEENPYTGLQKTPIDTFFVACREPLSFVQTPDIDNILGDKLTAFAPSTIGVPYMKGGRACGKEIIKQLYDIGNLFDKVSDMQAVASAYKVVAGREMSYRALSFTLDEVLQDTIDNALSVCFRENYNHAYYPTLLEGIGQVKSFVFAESFLMEKAVVAAAKTAYLATLIRFGVHAVDKYDKRMNAGFSQMQITEPPWGRFNKLKKSNPEAFFYLYKMLHLSTPSGIL